MTRNSEMTDRYLALGIPYPNPRTICKGHCEGTGWVPVRENDDDSRLHSLWVEAHSAKGEHDCDGYHFVKCPDCKGTGKRRPFSEETPDAPR